ncbi:IS200/IS605 family transposase [Stenomitos frigidus AS-A4]|uniref:IS200/IS605 family transposase n=2 Tax=Cyanobacteriota TaxID=1117 RepID=A0ABV0KSF0_9CYAN
MVFVTKYRHPVITVEVEQRLLTLLQKLCTTQRCELLECKADLGTKDHIHLLIERHPTIAEAKLAEILKTITSREIRKEFKDFLKPYYWKPFFWKRGYCAVSSGGASLDVLKKYIEAQGYSD